MGEKRKAYRVLVAIRAEKRSLERPRLTGRIIGSVSEVTMK
jgi:hypothetical protein